MSRVIRGAFIRQTLVNTNPFMLLQRNEMRGGFYIEAPSTNSGTLAVSFDDPALTTTGDKAPILLAASEQYVESPPNANTGSVWVRTSSANDTFLYREDYLEE